MILLIDNFDSFVANIARYFRRMSIETVVMRNDQVSPSWIRRNSPTAIVVSPGPCTPNEAGNSMNIIQECSGHVPILGICLGHQAIGATFGARIIRAPEPFHGRQSTLTHNGHWLFDNVPQKFDACRYHSLVIDETTLPEHLTVTCRTADRTIMAIADDRKRLFGLQFHPESILTPFGFQILQNFAQSLGIQSVKVREPLFATETVTHSGRQSEPLVATAPERGPGS